MCYNSCNKVSFDKGLEVTETLDSFIGFSSDSEKNPSNYVQRGARIIWPFLKEVELCLSIYASIRYTYLSNQCFGLSWWFKYDLNVILKALINSNFKLICLKTLKFLLYVTLLLLILNIKYFQKHQIPTFLNKYYFQPFTKKLLIDTNV